MANWYVSSVAYTAISAFATAHTYSIGDIVRPTAAAEGRKQAYRCTTGGLSAGSEAAWTATFGATTTQGAAVFTAIGGDTYGWTAALGDIKTVINTSTNSYAALGDTIFLSSDHTETSASGIVLGSVITGTWTSLTTHFVSVSRAGSVPPVAADITAGASIINGSGNLIIGAVAPLRFEGVTITQAAAANFNFNSGQFNSVYFKSCALKITDATSSNKFTANNPGATVTLDATSLTFAHAGQTVCVVTYAWDLRWINTATPISGGTAPTTLFTAQSDGGQIVTCRGVDFSSYTGTLLGVSSAGAPHKVLLDSCKVSASATLFGGTPVVASTAVIELVNCWDGTNVLNTRVFAPGTVSTERTIVLSGGANDDIGAFALKLVTSAARIDKYVEPLDTFWIDVQNSSTGSSKTATVEIVSSAALNNDEIWLELEYMGTAGNPIAAFTTTLPATILTAAAAVTTSSATWSSSPGTPAYQKLQATFTPQRAGRVRGRVLCGKASTTVYVNPVLTIT